MNLLRNRPLATVCFAFLCALTVAAYTDSPTKLWLGGAALLFLALSLLRFRRKMPLLPIIAAVLLAALLYGYIRYDRYYALAERYEDEVTVTARVSEVTYTNGRMLGFTAECESVDGKAASGRLSVWAYTALLPEAGERVTFSATLSPVTQEDSTSLYLRARGVAAQAEDVLDLTVIPAEPRLSDRLNGLFTDLREALSRRLTEGIPGRGGALTSALLLGEGELLDDTLHRDFRRTGITHVLSLSGLHLSLLAGAFSAVCRRLRCPRRATMAGQIFLILFYMALTGFSVTITRAGLMTLLFSLSFFARRQTDGITSLSLAAALIALFSPAAAYDCGFWLSVIATLGILVRQEWHREAGGARKPASRLGRLLHAVADSLGVTLSATFATMPLIAFYFGEFSLLTPLCNLLIIPLFDLCLLLAVPALALVGIPAVGIALSTLAELALSLVELAASLPGILLPIDDGITKLVLLLAACATLFCLCAPRVGRKRTALVGLCSLLLLSLSVSGHQLYRTTVKGVYYSYTGENELLLIQEGNAGLLCDLSSGSYAAQKNGLHAVAETHLTELEGYLITHYHARHTESLPRLASQITIRTLYLPTPQSKTEEALYRELKATAEAHGITCVRYEPYEKIPFGDATVQPHASGENGSAHPTLALSVRHGERMLTYLGAGHHESDKKKTAASAVRISDYLIFGLHGGREETLPSYPVFSRELTDVLLPYEARIPAALADFLGTRVRVTEEGSLAWLPL